MACSASRTGSDADAARAPWPVRPRGPRFPQRLQPPARAIRMDFLDQPTHTLILLDLATNLAQDAAAGKLEQDDFAMLGAAPTTSDLDARVSASSARSYLAQARFAIATADAVHDEVLDRTAAYLEEVLGELEHLSTRLATAHFDESLQLGHQWPLPDELGYTLTEALLKLANVLPKHRKRALTALASYVRTVSEAVVSSDATAAALIVSRVPQLHGVARALQDVPFAWTRDAYAPLIEALGDVATSANLPRLDALLVVLPEQHEAAGQCLALEDEVSVGASGSVARPSYAEWVLQHYATLGVPLSGRLLHGVR